MYLISFKRGLTISKNVDILLPLQIQPLPMDFLWLTSKCSENSCLTEFTEIFRIFYCLVLHMLNSEECAKDTFSLY